MARLLLNPISSIWFDGWKTDTAALGAAGWDISVSENYDRRCFDMLLYHSRSDIKMLAVSRCDPMERRYTRLNDFANAYLNQQYPARGPEFRVVQAWAGKALVRIVSDVPTFSDWSDMKPTMVDVSDVDVMSLPVFQKKAAPVAEELIVEPQDVMQLLDQIKRMQAPEQAEIRRKNSQIPVAHATILTFDRAA